MFLNTWRQRCARIPTDAIGHVYETDACCVSSMETAHATELFPSTCVFCSSCCASGASLLCNDGSPPSPADCESSCQPSENRVCFLSGETHRGAVPSDAPSQLNHNGRSGSLRPLLITEQNLYIRSRKLYMRQITRCRFDLQI